MYRKYTTNLTTLFYGCLNFNQKQYKFNNVRKQNIQSYMLLITFVTVSKV
jgi:hypothetical protein